MHNRAHHRQISVLRVCWLPTGAQAHIPHTSPRIVFFLLKLSVAANNFRVPRFLLRLRLPHSQFCLIAPGLPPEDHLLPLTVDLMMMTKSGCKKRSMLDLVVDTTSFLQSILRASLTKDAEYMHQLDMSACHISVCFPPSLST